MAGNNHLIIIILGGVTALACLVFQIVALATPYWAVRELSDEEGEVLGNFLEFAGLADIEELHTGLFEFCIDDHCGDLSEYDEYMYSSETSPKLVLNDMIVALEVLGIVCGAVTLLLIIVYLLVRNSMFFSGQRSRQSVFKVFIVLSASSAFGGAVGGCIVYKALFDNKDFYTSWEVGYSFYLAVVGGCLYIPVEVTFFLGMFTGDSAGAQAPSAGPGTIITSQQTTSFGMVAQPANQAYRQPPLNQAYGSPQVNQVYGPPPVNYAAGYPGQPAPQHIPPPMAAPGWNPQPSAGVHEDVKM